MLNIWTPKSSNFPVGTNGKLMVLDDRILKLFKVHICNLICQFLTFQRMLKSKHRAEVSLTPGNHELDNKQRKPKVRPGSAPITKGETETAQLSAGELDHLKQDEEVDIRPTVLLPEDSAEVEEMRKELMEDIKSMSKEELLKVLEENV